MRTVADVMRAPAVVVERSTSMQEASARMLEAGVHGAVVVEHGQVYGMVTAETLSAALAQETDPVNTAVGEIAERDPPLVREDDPVADVHLRMRAAGRTLVPVVAADGTPAGLLTD